MQQEKDPKQSTEKSAGSSTQKSEPDATSKETLGEIEKSENVEETSSSAAPSPDGQFDEQRDASVRNRSGPM